MLNISWILNAFLNTECKIRYKIKRIEYCYSWLAIAQREKTLHMSQKSSNSLSKENISYSDPEGILENNKEPRTSIKELFSRNKK